ncbi:ROK family protein [Paenibacillus lemnae]|uniref:ROK family protein n=1 Tax=Paenibacillus lemnae TaxID=1330551 RepID=A0A848M6V8_PAELE|nr:ROK family protein [Paenibacillus lemnae]NMO96445.1 ROK family protein [Paenibacillus lemnae]
MISADPAELHPAARNRLTLAVDAGGTVLKGSVLLNGELVPGVEMKRPSCSQGSAADIIQGLAGSCLALLETYQARYGTIGPDVDTCIGLAFPGPFDYAKGVALLRGVAKYEALYGLSVGSLLQEELTRLYTSLSTPATKALASAPIAFGNDALLFGTGVSLLFPSERFICLTLGTGLGSAFVAEGQVIAGKDGVPDNGMLFAEPYGDGIADHYFGRRGILRMAADRGMETGDLDVADLAWAAANGDEGVRELFQDYGRKLGELLLPYAAEFKPDRIVLGGQISNSCKLWEDAFHQVLCPLQVQIVQFPDAMSFVYKGIDRLFEVPDRN